MEPIDEQRLRDIEIWISDHEDVCSLYDIDGEPVGECEIGDIRALIAEVRRLQQFEPLPPLTDEQYRAMYAFLVSGTKPSP